MSCLSNFVRVTYTAPVYLPVLGEPTFKGARAMPLKYVAFGLTTCLNPNQKAKVITVVCKSRTVTGR